MGKIKNIDMREQVEQREQMLPEKGASELESKELFLAVKDLAAGIPEQHTKDDDLDRSECLKIAKSIASGNLVKKMEGNEWIVPVHRGNGGIHKKDEHRIPSDFLKKNMGGSNLSREDYLKMADEIKDGHSESEENVGVTPRCDWEEIANSFIQNKSFTEEEPIEPADVEAKNLPKEEESLSVPYIYAKKILLQGEFRYLDPPTDTNQISRFNGRYWEPLTEKKLRAIVYQEISEEDRLAIKNIESFCSAVAAYIKHECEEAYYKGGGFLEKNFRKIQNRIVFKNCVYDVKRQKKIGFDSRLPYYFGVDVTYTYNEVQTPYYRKLCMDAASGDVASMNMFDYAIAYLLMPNRTAKCMIVMANAKDSGKSVLGEFIAKLIEGDRAMTIDPEHLSGRFSYARAANAILYSCLEMSTRKLTLGEVRELKKITGDTVLRSEQKYEREQNVRIRFKLLLATNTGLILDNTVQDEAFYRRVVILPFIKSTPLDELKGDMPERLEAEKDYIVSKAVRKFGKHIQDDGTIIFPESRISREMKMSWANIAYYEDAFIKKCLIITGRAEDAVRKDDLYEAYVFFCESNKLNGKGIMCNRAQLIEKVRAKHPQLEPRKLRRDSILHQKGENEAKPCLVGLQIEPWFINLIRNRKLHISISND